ncbi:MAG: hypothetical protein PHR82_07800 [Endomicrobiaceae bacterium]|nr:hypothetical protein [Endomicrobiaceae bacterium]
MSKKRRKPKPSMPEWFWLGQDGCWFCKNNNNCNQCKANRDASKHDKKLSKKRDKISRMQEFEND